MTKTISFMSTKGGTGKSSLLFVLASQLIKTKKVLIIDFDSNTTLTQGLNALEQINQRDFNKSKPTLITSNLELLTGSVLSENIEVSAIKQDYTLNLFKERLNELAEKYNYDYILIDTPSEFLYLTASAVIACDEIVLTAIPDITSLTGIEVVKSKLQMLFNSCLIPAQEQPKLKIIENFFDKADSNNLKLNEGLKSKSEDLHLKVEFNQTLKNIFSTGELEKVLHKKQNDEFSQLQKQLVTYLGD